MWVTEPDPSPLTSSSLRIKYNRIVEEVVECGVGVFGNASEYREIGQMREPTIRRKERDRKFGAKEGRWPAGSERGVVELLPTL